MGETLYAFLLVRDSDAGVECDGQHPWRQKLKIEQQVFLQDQIEGIGISEILGSYGPKQSYTIHHFDIQSRFFVVGSMIHLILVRLFIIFRLFAYYKFGSFLLQQLLGPLGQLQDKLHILLFGLGENPHNSDHLPEIQMLDLILQRSQKFLNYLIGLAHLHETPGQPDSALQLQLPHFAFYSSSEVDEPLIGWVDPILAKLSHRIDQLLLRYRKPAFHVFPKQFLALAVGNHRPCQESVDQQKWPYQHQN